MQRALVYLLAAFLYVVWPWDLTPDMIVIVGWIDDLLVAATAVYFAYQSLRRAVSARPRPAGPGRARTEEPPPAAGDALPEDPYELLGLARGASPEQIKAAYRREMAKYHPDKVNHLAPEFRALAERRAKAIQRAYERLAG